jgi:hypothetical protein
VVSVVKAFLTTKEHRRIPERNCNRTSCKIV